MVASADEGGVATSVVELLTQRQRGSTQDLFGSVDLHVHFPAGAIPKDGPSAGVAVVLALTSLFLERPVRSDTAVTGEITLRGHVLPVGGIKEKVHAAHRAGIRTVLLPHMNEKHVREELSASIFQEMEIRYIKHIDEALEWAFRGDAATTGAALPRGPPRGVPGSSARAAGGRRGAPVSAL